MRRWIEGYYGLTPLFVLADWVFGENVRAVGLAGFPGLRAGYYAACLGCFGLAHYRPAWASSVAVAESTLNLLLLLLSVFLPYYALIDRVSESGGGANPFSPEFMVNFAIAGGVWCASYYSAMPSRRTFP